MGEIEVNIRRCKDFIKEIKYYPEKFYLIHYSCQNLYDDNEGLSPRITSIAVTHFASEQTLSFSTHAVAEKLDIDRDNVASKFNEVELELLGEFYKFIKDRKEMYWVHWNMRNLTYGFEHIEHRYKVLCQKDAPIIAVEKRINLNEVLKDRFGSGYVKDPKMSSLMELNGGIHRHFLKGPEEVEAFKNSEFIRMHNSTLCKIGFFQSLIEKLIKGELVVSANGWGVKLDRLFESRTAKSVSLVSSFIGIISIVAFFV